jgi:hypothetical protein
MNKTLGYTSTNGLSWTAASTVLNESQLPVPAGVNHLWAPTVRYYENSGHPAYHLYTPDITTASNKYSSRIFLSQTTTSPTSLFSYTGLEVQGPGNTNAGGAYMSDPEVFSDSATPVTDTSKDYLLWANGDNGSCGELSINHMTNAGTLDAVGTAANPTANIVINGWPANAWAQCTYQQGPPPPSGAVPVGTTINQPYIEGGSLFKFSNFNYVSQAGNYAPGPYTLVFALKPSSVPAQCAGSGQPNTANEVIAYATSASVKGPYDFQGIIMCGSSTEWTNQATIEEVQNAQGQWRLVLVYHDGPAGTNNRKLHSECLLSNQNGLGFKLAYSGVGTTRTLDGATDINGNAQWCLNARKIIAIKTPSGQYLTTKTAANGLPTLSIGGSIITTREEFDWEKTASETDFISAGGAEKYLTRALDGSMVATANGRAFSNKLWLVPEVGNTFELKDWTTGDFVVTDSSGNLRATSPSGIGATIFTYEVLAQ